jgi:hypothetical protein
MTQEDKELLLIDLCARLPYGVKVQYKGNMYDLTEMHKDGRTYLGSYNSIYGDWHCCFEFKDYPKPYLRPMSSMTEEEYKEYSKLWDLQDEFSTDADIRFKIDVFDWLNKHHFDYRGLIERKLAVAVTKENNPYE